MATKPAPKAKTTRVKKASSGAPSNVVHGAQPPTKPVNMNELFGIKSVYTSRTIAEYRELLDTYTVTDLRAHAHHVGVIPLDPREKLVSVLERKFMETQSKALPLQVVPTKVNPAMAEFHRQFMAGTVGSR